MIKASRKIKTYIILPLGPEFSADLSLLILVKKSFARSSKELAQHFGCVGFGFGFLCQSVA